MAQIGRGRHGWRWFDAGLTLVCREGGGWEVETPWVRGESRWFTSNSNSRNRKELWACFPRAWTRFPQAWACSFLRHPGVLSSPVDSGRDNGSWSRDPAHPSACQVTVSKQERGRKEEEEPQQQQQQDTRRPTRTPDTPRPPSSSTVRIAHSASSSTPSSLTSPPSRAGRLHAGQGTGTMAPHHRRLVLLGAATHGAVKICWRQSRRHVPTTATTA